MNWRKWRTRVFLVVGSLVFCFVVFEIILRLLYGVHLQYRVDDEVYWALEPSQTGFPRLGLPPATINSHGFRGPEPQEGQRNVLMLGDSYTFGWGVADNETMPAQLQHLLDERESGWQVLNAGVPGWGLFQQEVVLARVVERYRPEVVVLTLVRSDLYRLPFEDDESRTAYLSRARIRSFLRRSTALSFVKERLGGFLQTNFGATEHFRLGEELEDLWERNTRYLDGLSHYLGLQGTRLLVLVYPFRTPAFGEMVEAYCVHQGLDCITDLRESFEAYGEERLQLPLDGHPTPLAHSLAAARLATEINLPRAETRGRQ